ncbi:hypothetical protein OROMI_007067 [Orobanche minor]
MTVLEDSKVETLISYLGFLAASGGDKKRMPPEPTSGQEADDSDAKLKFVEIDPSGRYGRYKEVLGREAFKKVNSKSPWMQKQSISVWRYCSCLASYQLLATLEGVGFKNVLVIGADALSRYVDWTDRGSCNLSGDVAGAVLVEACDSEEDGLFAFDMHSDGKGHKFFSSPVPHNLLFCLVKCFR